MESILLITTTMDEHYSKSPSKVYLLADDFNMPQVNRKRHIWVYLPPDYDNRFDLRYPVLYLQDGQNVFNTGTSYAGEWLVDKTLDRFAEKGDDGVICIAINNGGHERMKEYSPYQNPKMGGGEGDLYVDFMADTLKPYIDNLFRTLPEPENTGILGSSMGGLISFYAGIKRPEVFGRVGTFSPSFWFSREIFNFVQDQFQANEYQKYYFYAGEQEGKYLVRDTEMMHQILFHKGFLSEEQLHLSFHSKGRHQEKYWKKEFVKAYKFLFDKHHIPVSRVAH